MQPEMVTETFMLLLSLLAGVAMSYCAWMTWRAREIEDGELLVALWAMATVMAFVALLVSVGFMRVIIQLMLIAR